MIQLPKVFGLVLCRSLTVDPAVGELSLTGVFQGLRFSVWPARAEPFVAYALLYGGAGEGTIELRVTRLETEADIYIYQRWITFPGRGLSVHMHIPVRDCVFPAPGRYLLTLRFDNKDLTTRHLDLYTEAGAS